MEISDFIWLDQFVDKLQGKHNVERDEAGSVFQSGVFIRRVEKGHRPDENLYAAYGQTRNGRYLVVFFIHKQRGFALVISARDMSPLEKRLYGRK